MRYIVTSRNPWRRNGMAEKSNHDNSQVTPESIFELLELERESGKLNKEIRADKRYLYSSSRQDKGKIDQRHIDGTVTTGTYARGQFIPDKLF